MFAMHHPLMRMIDSVSVFDSPQSMLPKFGHRMLLPTERPMLASLLNSASSERRAPIAPFLIDSSLIQALLSPNSGQQWRHTPWGSSCSD